LSNYSKWEDKGEISNMIGPRGGAALFKAICDCSTFKNILASNHTVRKISVDNADISYRLFVLE
jgi:hypothetical protein